MGTYRINHANSVFKGKPGTLFQSAEGQLLKAAVLSGAVSRVDPQSVEDRRPAPSEMVSDLQEPDESNAEATEPEPAVEGDQEIESVQKKRGKKGESDGGGDD